MPAIVTDERRSSRTKLARSCGVALGSPLHVVAPLVRATGPTFALRLASRLPKAISMLQTAQGRL